MPFCTKCGSSVADGAAFCVKCGSPMVAGPAGGPSAAGVSGLTSNVAALLSYVLGFITGILFLVVEPYSKDKFVRFHAFQSIFFSLVMTVFWIVWGALFPLGFFTLGFLWTLMSLVHTLISLAAFLYWLFLMYKAYNNERYMIPIIGELAAKQAG